MTSRAKHLYKFDRFTLDAGERVLWRDGELVPLTPKAFETLLVLVENNGRIMEKDDLLRRIWPDSFVEEATLAQNVFTLRKALNQSGAKASEAGGERRYIETVPRRGYRFVAEVQEVSAEEAAPAANAPAEQTRTEQADTTHAGSARPSGVGETRPTDAAEPHADEGAGLLRPETADQQTHVGPPGASALPHAAAVSEVSAAPPKHAAGQNGAGANGGGAAQGAWAPEGFLGAEGRAAGRGNPKLGAALIALCVVAAAAVVVYAVYRFTVRRETSQRPAASSFESMKVTRLAINGKVEEAIISPDGKTVAYLTGDGGRKSIWARQVSTTSNARQIVPAGDMQMAGIVFSHDGQYLYYVGWKMDDQPDALYQVPVFGGTPKKILERLNSNISLSPDGRQFAFARVGEIRDGAETSIVVADADGRNERVVVTRRIPEHLGPPAWSPDGRTIVCPLRSLEPAPGWATILEVSLADGRERQLTEQRWFDIGPMMWMRDGSGFVVNAGEQELSPKQMWLVSYPSGETRRVTNDLNSYAGVSLTDDGDALVTLQTDLISNVWVVPNGEAARARQITQGTGKYDGHYGVSWTPDGARIVYASIASGSWDIWVMDADGSNQKQLTLDARSNYGPSVSPDGRHIVFVSNRAGGAFNVWRMDIDGSNPKQLTDGKGENFPHVSPDGRWVIYASVGFGQPNYVWKVPIDGGQPVRLTDRIASWPFISPDGKFFACTYQTEPRQPFKLAIIPFDAGGAPVKTFDLPPTCMMGIVWLPDGRGIAYLDNRGGVANVWLQPTDGAPPRPLTDFKTEGVGGYDWSRNGKLLACSRGVENTGVVLIRDFR